jgi:hypothetical protein
MAKEIEVKGVERVVKNLSDLSDRTFKNLVNAAEAVQAMVINTARDLAPKVTHNLEKSIQAGDVIVSDGNVTAEIIANADYASYVEEGTRPHFPPLEPIREWASQVLGDPGAAFPIARKIAERGTKGVHFLENARKANVQTFIRAIQRAAKL